MYHIDIHVYVAITFVKIQFVYTVGLFMFVWLMNGFLVHSHVPRTRLLYSFSAILRSVV